MTTTRRKPLAKNMGRENLSPVPGATVKHLPRTKRINGAGNLTTNPASYLRPGNTGPTKTVGDRGGKIYDPEIHVNQHAEVVPLQPPIDRNGPAMSDTPILWRILARVDGGEWRWDLAGQTIESVTFGEPARMRGHLAYLQQQAAAMSSKVEYMVVPIFGGPRNL